YRIVPGGKPVAIFQPQELQVQALVVAKDGMIYAATNPDGKVYKIEPGAATEPVTDGRDARHPTSKDDHAVKQDDKATKQGDQSKPETTNATNGWKSSVFFDPGTKY